LRDQLDELDLLEKEPEDRVIMLEAAGQTGYQKFYEAVAAIQSAGGVIASVRDADTDDGEGG
jgi:biopolymer transport protein ExbD